MALTVGLWIFTILIGLLLLFAVLSNILVCYCVYKYRKLRNVTNMFICNLAVSDILLAGFVMPQKLHDISHTEEFHEGELLCKVVNFVPIFLITSSIYTLVGVSFERRRAVMESNQPQMTLQSLSKILPLVWIFSFLVSIPTLVEYKVNEITTERQDKNTTSKYLSCGSQDMSEEFSVSNAILVAVVSYILPVILMFKNYFQVAVFVWKRGKQVMDDRSDLRKAANFQLFKGRVKLVKLLVVVAVIFAVSWFPFFVMLLYAKITGNDASGDASGFVNLFLIALATFSTAYNVVLYVVFNPNFRRAIKQVVGCRKIEEVTQVTMVNKSKVDATVSTVRPSGQGTSMNF